MTYPDGATGRHASPVLGASRARQETRQGPRFTRDRPRLDRELAADIAAQFTKGEFCSFCLGIHPGAVLSVPGCPRIASCELDADGHVRSVTYWPDGEWDASGVYMASDVEGGEDG